MGLLAKFLPDIDFSRAVEAYLQPWYDGFDVPTWKALERLVRDRPVTEVLLDAAVLDRYTGPELLCRLRSNYPSVGVVLACSPPVDARALFEIGRRCGELPVVVPGVDDMAGGLGGVLAASSSRRTAGHVVGRLSGVLPDRELQIFRATMEWTHRGLSSDDLALILGYSRPHLSRCLQGQGLPSLGRLQVWARLLHSGRWLSDPGRSAQSVARQLEYADGAGFRRALRTFLGATPSEVVAQGGLPFVLNGFLADCDLRPVGRRGHYRVA
jgi:AraC-like DNA-binding protein